MPGAAATAFAVACASAGAVEFVAGASVQFAAAWHRLNSAGSTAHLPFAVAESAFAVPCPVSAGASSAAAGISYPVLHHQYSEPAAGPSEEDLWRG